MASIFINDFKKLTKSTILEHMDRLAVNNTVYSTHLKGYEPYLKDKNIIIYLHDISMVVVCFDLCGRIEEIADEGDRYDVDAPEYYSHKGSRTSPVWQLSETIKQMEDSTINFFPPIYIYGVLLSESNILNARDMKDKWESMNIHVIDNLINLRHREISTNENDNQKAKEIIDSIAMRGFSLKAPDYSQNSETNEPLVESVHVIEDVVIPDGHIEQNQNVTVCVEILRPISNPQKELDKLVGCTDIKKRMAELIALTKYNKLTKELFPNSKQHDVSLHSVFYGKPGTGKTTVCKIYGSLLRQAGALSKGHVVVCDRGTFIGTLWGDEERSMRQVLEMAQGGVLMVDEAYLLNGKHEGDPGKLVVQLMMNILADEKQRDIAIVLCGYKEPMEKLLESNPGLQSRFPNKFEFADFTIDELLEITRRRVKEYEYDFTPEAWDKYKSLLTKAYGQRDPKTWGNARFIANQLERIYIQHAMRCVKNRPTDKRQLRLLIPEDILPIEVPKEKRRIGF